MLKYRNDREKNIFKTLSKYKNEHVLYFWNEIGDKKKEKLLNEIENIDFKLINFLYKKFKNNKNRKLNLEQTNYLSINERSKELKSIGINALKANQVAFLTVAGGQGSRLGYDHPKGFYPTSPVKNKSLFQIFAEKIKFYSNYYKVDLNWYIMTSEFNYQEIVDYFNKRKYFGLNKNNVSFFRQGMFPSLTTEGKLILSEKDTIFKNPDGHGGILKALLKSGLLKKIIKQKIKHLSYFQVDNPMINMADPYFIGFHIKQKSMVSSKVIKKLYPEEKLGVIGKINGKNNVIEYSDLSENDMYAKNDNNELKYLMGSIAIHIFNVDFLNKFTKKMPIHFAQKKIKGYDFTENKSPRITDLDGIKFETFVFDAIPFAKKSVFFETEREVEFFPVKNKSGIDSIETSIAGQSKLFVNWLRSVGAWNGKYYNQKVEISPLYAPDKELFLEKADKDTDKINKAVFDEKGKIRDKIYIE